MYEKEDLTKIVKYSEDFLSLKNASLSDGYYYDSLALCLIDSVFSIGIRYSSVINVIHHFAQKANINIYRSNKEHPSDFF